MTREADSVEKRLKSRIERCRFTGWVRKMKKKLYIVQPSYRDRNGVLIKAGNNLFTNSLAVPALSAAMPDDWEKDTCLEYFEPVNLKTDAPVVGITCLGYDLFRGRELAEEFRKRGKIVLFGGCASELWKDQIQSVAHSVVSGNPGKRDLAKILADVENNRLVPEYHCQTDLDYPFDYSILARKPVADHISYFPALASAGCPFQCNFCCTAARYKGRYTIRSLEAVIADLYTLKRVTRRFVFVDSNFYIDRRHVIQLATRMIEERFNFFWSAESSVNIGDDPEVLSLLRRSGCRALLIGFETLAQHSLNSMGKPFDVNRYKDQIRNIQKSGIIVAGFFIFGFDHDDCSTVQQYCDFVRDLDIALAIFNFLCPVPGTRLHERMQAEGRLIAENQDSYLQQTPVYSSPTHRCLFQPKRMSPREAELAFVDLLRRISSWPAIIRRSVRLGPHLGPLVFKMNLSTRQASRAGAKEILG
jgi:radical SAM superfamily enzyme YgiQ (UPF0313 family)